MGATLEVTRNPPVHLPEVHRGTFDVVVDGERVGSFDLHETFGMPVERGRHTLRIRDGRYSSRRLSFEVTDGEAVSFNCHGRRASPIFLAAFIVPKWALNLKRTQAPTGNGT